MEKPEFPMPPGKYLVTGDRQVTTTLTISEKDAKGVQSWSLGDNAKLYDVTHLPCRSARYTPSGGTCTPDTELEIQFPVSPGAVMPEQKGCKKARCQSRKGAHDLGGLCSALHPCCRRLSLQTADFRAAAPKPGQKRSACGLVKCMEPMKTLWKTPFHTL